MKPGVRAQAIEKRIDVEERHPEGTFVEGSLEALPLFLNISGLDLVGETKFTRGEEGWIDENSIFTDATVIKSEAPLAGNLALILIGVTQGMAPDDVTVRGFVLDGSTPVNGNGFLIVADRAQRFRIRDTHYSNATYGVAAEGASGVVEGCFMTKLGEGVLVFGGNSTWPAEVTVRNTRSVENAFGGLVFFGTAFAPNSSFPPLADFGAYTGVFQPVPFSGADITVGHVIHRPEPYHGESHLHFRPADGFDRAESSAGAIGGQPVYDREWESLERQRALVRHQRRLRLFAPVRPTSAAYFFGLFGDNEATGSLTAKALVTFTRNNAAETLPGSMATWKYLANSRYQVFYSSGEFEPTSGSSGRVWIDNPSPDPGDPSRILNNELALKSR